MKGKKLKESRISSEIAPPSCGFIYWLARVIFWILFRFVFFGRCEGREHIPSSGPVVICPDHQSNWDPFHTNINTYRQKVFTMGKEELFLGIGKYITPRIAAFPVTREGFDRKAMRTAASILIQENVLVMFLQGTRDPTLLPFKDGLKVILGLAFKNSEWPKDQAVSVVPTHIRYRFLRFFPVVHFGKPIMMNQNSRLDVLTDKVRTDVAKMRRRSRIYN